MTGDFNARAAKWWRNDMNTNEGTKIDSITTSYGFSQIISDMFWPNSYSSKFSCMHLPNFYKPTSQWTQHVESTSIRCEYYVDTSKGMYPRVSTLFPRIFWCNFNGWKIDVMSTYFLWRNFDGLENDVVLTYFLWHIFDGQKIDVVLTYFLPGNFDGRNIDVVSM